MKRRIRVVCAAAWLIQLAAPGLLPQSRPFAGKNFNGRIAYTADGNHNDQDDWAASPMALGIFASAGLKGKLVHFDYNSILPKTDPEWERIHAASVLGAAERFGYPMSIFHDDQKDLAGSVESIRKAIDASSAENPLYFIVAGPMEIAYMAIQKSNPEKRKYVYIISHSRWNDGFSPRYSFRYNKRSVIPLGIHWVQIADQNRLLSTSPYGREAKDEEWIPWHWMRDAQDPRVRFLWDRMRVSTRGDCSDAGMAYFLATGDEEGDPVKLRKLLVDRQVPEPVAARRSVRIEAENFQTLENYELEFRDDPKVSHRINIKLTAGKGRIKTPFYELFSEDSADYNVDVRYLDEKDGHSRLALYVNGALQGEPWQASSDDDTWKIHHIANLKIKTGDEIAVEVEKNGGESCKLDYIELTRVHSSAGNHFGRVGGGARLDDPAALPGQLIVAGGRPGYLKYNGSGVAFLAGPDNPEDFLYRGTLQPGGTRSGGGQEERIQRMAKAGGISKTRETTPIADSSGTTLPSPSTRP